MRHKLPTDRDFTLEDMRFRGEDVRTMRLLSGERVQSLTQFAPNMRRVVYWSPTQIRNLTLALADDRTNTWQIVNCLALPWEDEVHDHPETRQDAYSNLGDAPRFHFTPPGLHLTTAQGEALWGLKGAPSGA